MRLFVPLLQRDTICPRGRTQGQLQVQTSSADEFISNGLGEKIESVSLAQLIKDGGIIPSDMIFAIKLQGSSAVRSNSHG